MNNIALICDDNYCLPTAVCIQSIIDNTNVVGFTTVHVCTFGLTEINRQFILNLNCDRVHIEINNFSKNDYLELLSKVNPKTHVSTSALIKFELANYFSQLDSLLYLDSDIVLKKDISEIFNTDISKSYLAASFEYWNFIHYREYSFKRDYKVEFNFNSGVMLLNLQKMRKDNIPQQLWDYKLYHSKTPRMDQESFNMVCGAATVPISIKWNFNPCFAYESNLIHINSIYNESYLSINNMIEDVRIIHYVGKEDKPWEYMNARMREFWDIPFSKLNIELECQNKVYIAPKQKPLVSFRNKIRQYGAKSTFCYIINKIFGRI